MLATCWLLLLAGAAAAAQGSPAAPEQARQGLSEPGTGTPAEADVVVFNRTVATFRATAYGVTPQERARRTQRNVERLLDAGGPGTVRVQAEAFGRLVMLDDTLAILLTEADVDPLHAGETLEAVAQASARQLSEVVAQTRESRDGKARSQAILKAVGATAAAAAIVWLLLRGRRALSSRLVRAMHRRADGLRLGGARILRRDRLAAGLRMATTGTAWGLVLLAIVEWLGFVLRQFPYTRPWGEGLQKGLLEAVTRLGAGIAGAVPGVVTALAIFVLARIATSGLRAFFAQFEQGRASSAFLDRDTAGPTRRIATVLVWLFALVMAYPYLPGAQTEAFKGMSVLFGVMISLGASSIFGQAASGVILMYSRALRRGEYVRIGEHEGTVTELGVFSTRLLTGTGEEIALPNATVIGSATVNFSRVVRGPGFIVETTVTIGYDTPWRQVEAMLVEAAASTPGIRPEPAPRVLQMELADHYPVYRLVCHATPRSAEARADVMSALHARIQDVFNSYGVQIMSPHYMADPPDAKIVPRSGWFAAPARPPGAEAIEPTDERAARPAA